MIRYRLTDKRSIDSAVINGVLYLRFNAPVQFHAFSSLDVGKVVEVEVLLADSNMVEVLPCEVVEYFIMNGDQYLIVREISENALQQFEECC